MEENIADKMVPITTFEIEMEAFVTRGKLQSEGIVSFVTKAARSGFCLWVKESVAEEAIRILKESNVKGTTDIPEENVRICPACESTDIGYKQSLLQKINSFVFPGLLFTPSYRSKLKSKCKKCGYEWKVVDE
jgi:hypothetical protein